jgi:hypothetical protein
MPNSPNLKTTLIIGGVLVLSILLFTVYMITQYILKPSQETNRIETPGVLTITPAL